MICRKFLMKSKCQTRNVIVFNRCRSSRKLQEIFVLENSIHLEKEKQQNHTNHMMKRGELMIILRWHLMTYQVFGKFSILYRLAIQHMMDVLRHVGNPDFYKNLEFPTVNLKLPILHFNPDLPRIPTVMDTNSKHCKLFLQILNSQKFKS